jgi:hypothetical protein
MPNHPFLSQRRLEVRTQVALVRAIPIHATARIASNSPSGRTDGEKRRSPTCNPVFFLTSWRASRKRSSG